MWTDELITELNQLAEKRRAQERISEALRLAIQQMARLEAQIAELQKENQRLRSAQELPELQ